MARVKYTIGDEVAHLDNLGFKMRVRSLVFGNEKRLEHIKCSWWVGPEMKVGDFHSHELVLWNIASQGKEQVESYLDQIDKENTIKSITEEK